MSWPWSGSALPATAGAVTPRMCSLLPGISRKLCGSGFGTMGGISSVGSRRIAASPGPSSGPIGVTRMGRLTGGLEVLVVRYGATYFATHRLRRPATEVRQRYRLRSQIEEVICVCTDQLGLSGCRARSKQAQAHHIIDCLIAFCVLERERHERGLTIYKLKQLLSCHGRTIVLPALQRLSRAAYLL